MNRGTTGENITERTATLGDARQCQARFEEPQRRAAMIEMENVLLKEWLTEVTLAATRWRLRAEELQTKVLSLKEALKGPEEKATDRRARDFGHLCMQACYGTIEFTDPDEQVASEKRYISRKREPMEQDESWVEEDLIDVYALPDAYLQHSCISSDREGQQRSDPSPQDSGCVPPPHSSSRDGSLGEPAEKNKVELASKDHSRDPISSVSSGRRDLMKRRCEVAVVKPGAARRSGCISPCNAPRHSRSRDCGLGKPAEKNKVGLASKDHPRDAASSMSSGRRDLMERRCEVVVVKCGATRRIGKEGSGLGQKVTSVPYNRSSKPAAARPALYKRNSDTQGRKGVPVRSKPSP